jgi:hypothetical protein
MFSGIIDRLTGRTEMEAALRKLEGAQRQLAAALATLRSATADGFSKQTLAMRAAAAEAQKADEALAAQIKALAARLPQ